MAKKQVQVAQPERQSGTLSLAAVTRLAALSKSIEKELNESLSGIIINASACLRMLAADPPKVEAARETARRTIRDSMRASDAVAKLRTSFGETISVENCSFSVAQGNQLRPERETSRMRQLGTRARGPRKKFLN